MIDPRRQALLIDEAKDGQFVDKTRAIDRWSIGTDGTSVEVVFSSGPKTYRYSASRVLILRSGRATIVPEHAQVEVDGGLWSSARETISFHGPRGDWTRVFYAGKDGVEKYVTRPAEAVRVVADGARSPEVRQVLAHLQAVVRRLPDDNPIRRPYAGLDFVHPDSALHRWSSGAPVPPSEPPAAAIFPFRRNRSQWAAVLHGLGSPISVIEGPPGTGKTETILNLIANIVLDDKATVGVVSLNNAAVENVRDKLTEAGFGHIVADLGRKEKRDVFFATQATRNAQVRDFARRAPEPPDESRLAELDARLRTLHDQELRRAELRQQLAAWTLEQQHFERYVERHDPAGLGDLPLLRRSSDKIMDFLVETQVDFDRGRRPGWVTRIRRYLKYGSLHHLDPEDTDVVLGLQSAFYAQRTDELRSQLDEAAAVLQRGDFESLVEEHRQLSLQQLHAALGKRHHGRSQQSYSEETYRRGAAFRSFVRDYPVLLSTCHSLRASLPDGFLLDYLIIDEASQVDLLAAALALSCCRTVVVVGDLQQLSHIPAVGVADLAPPSPPYDYRKHSILSSIAEVYSDDEVPRTLLREHYRCDPAIIGFCNSSFYDGELVPFTRPGSEPSMMVVRTREGNHMRQHRAGGRSNQREVDVIAQEVIERCCSEFAPTDIGITTPYRLQADKAGDVLDQLETDTVHRFQGRQKKVVILTTVIDETWRGQRGLDFVDDPRLVNVAVSRAAERFILVTNHGLMHASRYLRDLIGYIRYQTADNSLMESTVLSVFDLLYREHSARLRPLAERLKNEMEFKSEDIVWTLLQGMLLEQRYRHLRLAHHVLLRNLVADVSGLTPRQAQFIRRRASVDFVVYNRTTNEPVLAVEVDGFAYHENDPKQLARDRLKDEILEARGLKPLRLPTTGSGEELRLRQGLDEAQRPGAVARPGVSDTFVIDLDAHGVSREVDLRSAGYTQNMPPSPA